jgi:hypothetical protein
VTRTVVLIFVLLAGCRTRDFADRVLVHGNVLTVDSADTIAQAIAIRDGRILAVGTNEEIEALAGPETERIDLNGRTATPGLLDAHCHFAWGGNDLLSVLDLSYPKVQKVTDVVDAVRTRATELSPGEWVRGQGWDEGKLVENRYLYASDLDDVSLENPVWLTHTMGHYGVANSLALEKAGITRETPDPPSGTIDRDRDGTPTGVLKESAQMLVLQLIPPPGPDEWKAGIEHMARELNQEGMTGLKEPGIGDAEWQAYQRALADGNLSVRVFALRLIGETWTTPTTVEDARGLAAKLGPTRVGDRLVAGGVKMFMDGSGGARTAWVYDDWNQNHTGVDAGNQGYPLFDPEVVREQIQALHDAGIHVSVHAIGDRAIDWVVDSYALALEKNPTKGLRHGIIHANIPTDHALDEMERLQREYDAAYPEPSATFMWWIGDTYAGNFGPKRTVRLNPFRTYLERDILWADGSDFGVTPFPARYGLWASVKRQPLLGTYGDEPYGSEQGVDIQTAIRSRTIWAARQMFLENEIGSLEVGKYADIAVWDKDPYSIPADEIQDLECQMTLLEGEVVYERK